MVAKILPWFTMPKLILIPTAFERDHLLSCLRRDTKWLLHDRDWTMSLCGFGLVAAAARAAQCIASYRPQHVMLVGIAGSYGDAIPVGEACYFSAVRCAGIGIGSLDQDSYQSAESLGWPQLLLESADNESIGAEPVGDELKLHDLSDVSYSKLLLSVTGAAANRDDAARRAAMFPGAIAEDMEGYAVALACKLYGVPLTIIRGISNEAGDRNHGGWQVAEALQSAAKLLSQVSLQLKVSYSSMRHRSVDTHTRQTSETEFLRIQVRVMDVVIHPIGCTSN